MGLKEIKNLKFVFVRTCETCKYGYYDGEGCYCCKRINDNEGNVLFDVGEGKHHEMKCDRYRGK